MIHNRIEQFRQQKQQQYNEAEKKHEFNFSMPENYPLAVQSSSNDPLHAAAASTAVVDAMKPHKFHSNKFLIVIKIQKSLHSFFSTENFLSALFVGWI